MNLYRRSLHRDINTGNVVRVITLARNPRTGEMWVVYEGTNGGIDREDLYTLPASDFEEIFTCIGRFTSKLLE